MKQVVIYLLVLMMVGVIGGCCCPSRSQPASPDKTAFKKTPDPQQEYAARQVIVKFRPDLPETTIARLQLQLKLATLKILMTPGLYLMCFDDNRSVQDVIDSLRAFDGVVYAEPNYIQRLP